MADYPIHDDAWDDRLAYVGTSGSGKTYAAGTGVEHLLGTGAKVVIVDPLDVWYGLRVSPDGKTPAFPVVIFGGERADIPINEEAGSIIGEAVATMRESCVVSLSTLGSKAAERRFMLSFLESLYRRATRDPMHIVFDEADLWAPQNAQEPKLLSLMENIVRRGRVKGFIPWLITQRPAVISKDVLSQVDGLVAMKLTSSQDRKALGAWIEGQADRDDQKRILARLPELKRGEGILWLPAHGVLEEVVFPEKQTFDSSATPKRGERARTAALQPLDTAALTERIKDLAIAREKGRRQAAPPSSTGMELAHAAHAAETARQMGFEEGYRAAADECGVMIDAVVRAVTAALTDLQREFAAIKALPFVPAAQPKEKPPLSTFAGTSGRAEALAASDDTGHTVTMLEGADPLSTMALALLAEAQARWPARFNWVQLATLVGRKARGGSFNAARKQLLSGKHVSEENGLIVPAYRKLKDWPPTAEEVLKIWLDALPSPARELLEVIAYRPKGITQAELASRTKRQPRGGSWNGALSTLRRNGLIREERGLILPASLLQP